MNDRWRLENWTRKKSAIYEQWKRMTGTTINFVGGISFGTAVALRLKLCYSRYTEIPDTPDVFAEIKQRFLDTWSVYRSPQPASYISSHLVSFTSKYSLAAQMGLYRFFLFPVRNRFFICAVCNNSIKTEEDTKY